MLVDPQLMVPEKKEKCYCRSTQRPNVRMHIIVLIHYCWNSTSTERKNKLNFGIVGEDERFSFNLVGWVSYK
jgi:hypothetical protein